MHIKFKIGKFLEALNLVMLTVDKTGNLETRDVLFSAVKEDDKQMLYLYATDYVNQSAVKLDVEVIEAGDLPFNPAQLIISLSSRNPEDEAIIISNDKQSVIKIGRSKFQLQTTGKLNLLPRLKAIPFGWKSDLEFTHDKLTDIFGRAKACVSNDVNNTNRYLMRGMHLKSEDNKYIIQSTDGFSGANIVVDNDKELAKIDLILPGEFTNILLKLETKAKKLNESIKLIQNNYIFFGFKDYLVGTSIMTGKFPDISKIINKPEVIINIDNKSLKTSITRILGFDAFSSQAKGGIALNVENKTLTIKSTTQNNVEEFIDFEYDLNIPIPNRTITIDGQKLQEIIGTFSLGQISLGIGPEETTPLYIEENIKDKLLAKYVMVPKRS